MIATEAGRVLIEACAQAGVDPGPAKLLRLSENAVYRLADGIVARVSRPGKFEVAASEVRVARWLECVGFTAVRVSPGIDQPVAVGDVAVTFWQELPAHREGEERQVAEALRRLHELDPPADFTLPAFAPFEHVGDRIDGSSTISPDDRAWLRAYQADLERRYSELPAGLPRGVVHGDAWFGNVAVDREGTAWLLDLERFCAGPPEWDLIATAVRMTTFGTLDAAGLDEFCAVYGHDVTDWDGFETLRDIRELRQCAYMLELAPASPAARAEAARRVACLRGFAGPRPWGWQRVV